MSRAEVLAEAGDLPAGASRRIVCPFCGGGNSRERSMNVTHDEDSGNFLYHCFRANCGMSGMASNGVSDLVRTRSEPKARFVPFDASRVRAPIPQASPAGDFMQNVWRISPTIRETQWWGIDAETGRLALPVFGTTRDWRGYVLRSMTGAEPKTLNAMANNVDPFIAWCRPFYGERPMDLYIVEDIPSATRLQIAGCAAVALLGTYMTDDAASEIVAYANANQVRPVITLDPDAVNSVFRILREQALRFRLGVVAAYLKKDIKDMSEEELSEWLVNAR